MWLPVSIALSSELGKLILLVLVPTISLTNQWSNELLNFNYEDVILVSSDNSSWSSELQSVLNSFKLETRKKVAIIATYDSFKTPKFQSFCIKFPNETMLLADEAHNMGAPEVLNKLPHKIRYRLGLSATPHRHFDDSGTNEFLMYFNVAKASTFVFSMHEAISKQYLCQYKLFPHFAKLNEKEYVEYIKLTKAIASRAHIVKNKFTSTDAKLERMLRDRRNILNKAAAKKKIVGEIIDQIKRDGEIHHTLIYSPEGMNEEENSNIIDDLGRFLAFDKGLRIAQFTGTTPPDERNELLNEFEKGKIQCLLAMKCLDEGIDVKQTETAIFVSSTTNPRQYVQRRGRVLRVHNKKPLAYIHDIIAIPPKLQLDDPKIKEIDKIILTQEFKRYKEFAEDALNYVDAITPIKELCKEYNIEL